MLTWGGGREGPVQSTILDGRERRGGREGKEGRERGGGRSCTIIKTSCWSGGGVADGGVCGSKMPMLARYVRN